jgi:outer membrane biosynthesis protein TonB
MLRRPRPVARRLTLIALALATACWLASCSGGEKVKGAISSRASGVVPSATQLPAPSEGTANPSPSETPESSPSETSESTPSESPRPTRSPRPSVSPSAETPESSPSETSEPTPSESPRPTKSPQPSISPSAQPTQTPTTASGSPAVAASSPAASSGGSSPWIWIVLGLAVLGVILALAIGAKRRGNAAAAWRSRARDPYSEGVVLFDRLGAELAAPEVAGDRIDQALEDLDGVSEKLNALTVDAPDDRSAQALSQLLMTLGTLRSSLQQVRQADPVTLQAASATARGRLADFEASLQSFRSSVWPQTRSG